MAVSGGYLELQMRGRILTPILQYRECIFREVLPVFSNISQRADRIANEYYANIANQPVGEDEDYDLGCIAEDAESQGIAFYETMTAVRQTMLNLLAAGLFHLMEQQLAELCRDGSDFLTTPAETKIGTLKAWLAAHYRLDLSQLEAWPLVDELRLLANTAKHAEINQTERLRELRPELFHNPIELKLDALIFDEGNELLDEERTYITPPSICDISRVFQPLAGTDLFVSDRLLARYVDGVEAFFGEIANHFDLHQNDPFPLP